MEIVNKLDISNIINEEKNEIWMIYTYNCEKTIDYIIPILNKNHFNEIYIYDLVDVVNSYHEDYKTSYQILAIIKKINLNSIVVINVKYIKNYRMIEKICRIANKRNLMMIMTFINNEKIDDCLKKYKIKLFVDERNEENEC